MTWRRFSELFIIIRSCRCRFMRQDLTVSKSLVAFLFCFGTTIQNCSGVLQLARICLYELVIGQRASGSFNAGTKSTSNLNPFAEFSMYRVLAGPLSDLRMVYGTPPELIVITQAELNKLRALSTTPLNQSMNFERSKKLLSSVQRQACRLICQALVFCSIRCLYSVPILSCTNPASLGSRIISPV